MAAAASPTAAAVKSAVQKPLVFIDYTKDCALQEVNGKVFEPLERTGRSLFDGVNIYLDKLAVIRDRAERSSSLFQSGAMAPKNLQKNLVTYVFVYEKAKNCTELLSKALIELRAGIDYGIKKHNLEAEVASVTVAEKDIREAAKRGLSSVRDVFNGLATLKTHLVARITNIEWHLKVANCLAHGYAAPAASITAGTIPMAAALSKEFAIPLPRRREIQLDEAREGRESAALIASDTDKSGAEGGIEDLALSAEFMGTIQMPETVRSDAPPADPVGSPKKLRGAGSASGEPAPALVSGVGSAVYTVAAEGKEQKEQRTE